MILAGLLSADSHIVRGCRWCGRVFPADLDHSGKRHAATRLYCSPRCRAVAALHRRTPRRRFARQWSWLTDLHALEAAGQQALPGQDPLPDLPPYEETA